MSDDRWKSDQTNLELCVIAEGNPDVITRELATEVLHHRAARAADAERIRRTVRNAFATVTRMGGEEFLQRHIELIATDVSKQLASSVPQRVALVPVTALCALLDNDDLTAEALRKALAELAGRR